MRLHQLTSPGRWRAMTALLLLGPWTPMLFQGQEMQSSRPFLYFADLRGELADAVRKGRAEFLTQFPSVAAFEAAEALDNPSDRSTFERCKLDWVERDRHAEAYALHADLLGLRRSESAFHPQTGGTVDGAVLSAAAFTLRFFTPDHLNDHVLILNLGTDLDRNSFAEPLLAPPPDRDWFVRWSSNDPRYGGSGVPETWPQDGWHIPGESAIVLAPGPRRFDSSSRRRQRRTA
jgi:maltooligosyltrehalose trehalohydrolase